MATKISANNQDIIIVTGAAGFIGSCLVQQLNDTGIENIVMVDDFGVETKRRNWEYKKFIATVERLSLFDWLATHQPNVAALLHIGARTDTTEFDYAVHEKLNVQYSKDVWSYCTAHKVPLIYASSAATYGDGSFGYNDDHSVVAQLKPLNPYGVSKNEFDKWALHQAFTLGSQPPYWAGLKFFNVYGPNEYHKGRMASVIFHAFHQIAQHSFVKLFKSHRPDFEDGQQLRDFIYVKDVVAVIFWMMKQMLQKKWLPTNNGLYNLGTGQARSFYDLAVATFDGLDKTADIKFINMPEDIRDKYQYFTEANMQKLRNIGYQQPFYSLEKGVDDYVRHYLKPQKFY